MDIGLNAPLERRHSLPLLPAMQLEIVKCDLRLRGIRIRQLAACNTKTVQYRLIWGEYPNRYHTWVDGCQWRGLLANNLVNDLIPQVERAVMRVLQIRSSQLASQWYRMDGWMGRRRKACLGSCTCIGKGK
jgi:hypothetical protein